MFSSSFLGTIRLDVVPKALKVAVVAYISHTKLLPLQGALWNCQVQWKRRFYISSDDDKAGRKRV